MSLFKQKVELIVIRDPSNPQSMEYYSGSNLEDLVKQAFKDGISDSVRFYHADLTKEVFGLDERKDKAAIKAFCGLKGRVYAQVVPMGLEIAAATWWAIGASVAVSLAATFLLAPKMPNMGNQSQPSPNNALASRSNEQRLGGRIPDIFGEVWSVPDLIAPTYSIYDNSREVEFSYMCVGRGKYDIKKAFDDTTPIGQVSGSGVLIYDPDTTLDDAPINSFGEYFNPSEAEYARLAAKRYTSVNGQTLPYPNNYAGAELVFKAPNIIESVGEFSLSSIATVGQPLLIEGAVGLTSSTGAVDVDNSDPENPIETPITYTFDGSYNVLEVTSTQVKLELLGTQNQSWDNLQQHNDTTNPEIITLSRQADPLWQGWYYTEDRTHDGAYINVIAPNGLYVTSKSGNVYGRRVEVNIESELVDASNNAIAGTQHTQVGFVAAPDKDDPPRPSTEDERRETAASTIKIANPHYVKGTRMRVRVSRKTGKLEKKDGSVVQEVKLKDFYSYRTMTANDYPQGVTTVYAKTLATEGALSIKERKLRLLVERYVTDYTTKELKLSKRADDIIYHIATDPKIGNLTDEQIDFEQIKNEIDVLVGYFGSEKFAEFCYTFDDNNLSSEEIIQTVARAVFSNAKRYGNKLMLDFEREVPASVAVFNSHNILPDSYAASESFGVINEYDGAKVEYADPVDDAQVTKSYPSDAVANPHTEKLIGVRNELQATAHMMRLYNKDRFTYKSCEITAGDESNIVTRTNRITVASQTAVDVQQGTVEAIEVIGSDIVLHTSNPVNVSDGSYLFIQTINNGVESIACSPRDEQSVTLARLPQGELSIRNPTGVNAVYHIVGSSDGDKDAYIVTKKDPSDGMTNKLTCTNYSSKFYQNDKDYLNSI